ncbi:MAG: triose-phosphate isomerase [Desulfobacteraceae bacterium 4572_130]|nr:MAG: triose-phosphate isomerase [Desulfobacteraceae bacterium 4572_130]
MNRIPLIAGNWKMFKTIDESVSTAAELAELSHDVKKIDIMLAPTSISLYQVSQKLKNTNIQTGAQNIFYEDEGAYTGEISAKMIKAAGAKYVILGHSERRQYFGETDDSLGKKIKAAIEQDLIPILCIGETEKQRDENNTLAVLNKQIENGLKGFSSQELKNIVLAYEPVWAIGTGKTATPDQVNKVHKNIRSFLGEILENELANSIRILYGGSVNSGNVAELMALEDVDGALVGGASLGADKFIKIIKYKV